MNGKEILAVSITSLAFSTALYAFLSGNPKYRESSTNFLVVAGSQVICAIIACVIVVLETFDHSPILQFIYLYFLLFGFSWLYLFLTFVKIYVRLYHLREERFLKYMYPFSRLYDVWHLFHLSEYEQEHNERGKLELEFLGISHAESNMVKHGGVILLLSDDDVDVKDLAIKFLVDGIKNNETGDYVTCELHPIVIWDRMLRTGIEKNDFTTRFAMIDAFSPHYAYDDKVMKYKLAKYIQEKLAYFPAKTVSGIHSAVCSSWHRYRKLLFREEKGTRRPHRMVYDSISSQISVSGVELVMAFIKHTLSSEKTYGMITLLLEKKNINPEVLSLMLRMSDIIIDIPADVAGNKAEIDLRLKRHYFKNS